MATLLELLDADIETETEAEDTSATAPPLLPHQVHHVQRLQAIWAERCFYLDTSPMGTGKTHVAANLLRAREFAHVFIICPLAVKSMWRRVLAQYGLVADAIITYEALRSKRGCRPAHGLLTRAETAASGGGGAAPPKRASSCAFSVTPHFKALVREGLCIVADECQRVKNRSAQQQALQALCREIVLARLPHAKFALLSGTPFDKRDQVLRLLQLAVVLHSSRMFTFHTAEGRMELQGAAEIIQCAAAIDATATAAVLEATPFVRANVTSVCYELYVHVIQGAVSSAMAPPTAAAPLRCVNGFYDVPPEDVAALQASIRALHSATKFNPDAEHAALADADWYAITKALQAIESAKVGMFVRLAREALAAHPSAKVVVALQFLQPIAHVAAALADFCPLVLTGASTTTRRDADIAAFQASSSERRLLVGNIAVLELGIDLDDTHGDFPRTAFASPGYAVMRVHQFTRRFHRVHTRSAATIAFVFGKCASIESSILNALRRKTEVLSDTLRTQVEHGMRFPGDYDVLIEDADGIAGGFDSAELLRHVGSGSGVVLLPCNYIRGGNSSETNVMPIETE